MFTDCKANVLTATPPRPWFFAMKGTVLQDVMLVNLSMSIRIVNLTTRKFSCNTSDSIGCAFYHFSVLLIILYLSHKAVKAGFHYA